ncbi:MAG: hypothetical protein R2778_02775 [Saprospiraceae bacterium]
MIWCEDLSCGVEQIIVELQEVTKYITHHIMSNVLSRFWYNPPTLPTAFVRRV